MKGQAKAGIVQAEAELEKSERYLRRLKAVDGRGITQTEMDAAETGAESRRAIGVATFSGMVASVVVGTLLVPGLYVLFCSRCNNK